MKKLILTFVILSGGNLYAANYTYVDTACSGNDVAIPAGYVIAGSIGTGTDTKGTFSSTTGQCSLS